MTENGVAQVPPDEDRTPTQEDAPPVTPPAEAWVMPEPVFRQSEGYTPKAPRPTPDDDPATTERDMHASEDAVANPAAPIAEQPLLADVVTDPPANVTFIGPKKKGGFLRMLLLIIGIGAIALVVAAVVTAIVFWYFFQVSESQNLN